MLNFAATIIINDSVKNLAWSVVSHFFAFKWRQSDSTNASSGPLMTILYSTELFLDATVVVKRFLWIVTA